jgi:predicted N-acetyltransferase YhbS
MSPDTTIRAIRDGDWDRITALESRAYTALGLSEEPAALRSRASASPDTCFVLDAGERLAGYLLALPYPASRYPDLRRTEARAFRTDNLHLHDMVVAEDLRGRGLGRRLAQHLTDTASAQGYRWISLVAVGGSESFWSAVGFAAHEEVPAPETYGSGAVYMARAVPAETAREPGGAEAAPPGSPAVPGPRRPAPTATTK